MNRPFKSILAIILTLVCVICIIGCNKSENDDVRVTTYSPQDITVKTVKCGGDVIVTQGLSLTELGVCWSTERNPQADDDHLCTTNWDKPFVCTITGLEPNTKYHIRAYALRGLKYYYGEDKSFTTKDGNSGGDSNIHEYIDLGLPSGTLWATCNVGANSPEKYGDYFAWGETTPKNIYDWSTYKYCNGSYDKLTKYCCNTNYGDNGYTDNLTDLEPEDDAAVANWGDDWCIPSNDQWRELRDNTISTWTTQNGIEGFLLTAVNGNSLFLPASGGFYQSSTILVGEHGFYWSSSLATSLPFSAYDFNFPSGLATDACYFGRCGGRAVRPVTSFRQ